MFFFWKACQNNKYNTMSYFCAMYVGQKFTRACATFVVLTC